ncbi:MAG TPA: hypothetical protein VNV60_07045 [Holophagaceae bacterium]|jgi:hypothetical protein|nr:hypothetical protein [Holophagaceae bacterium]
MKLVTILALAAATALPAQTIAIINSTKSVSNATIQATANAVASQVHNEYKARWGNDATFVFVAKGTTPPKGAWNVYVDDRKGDYHTVTTGNVPVAYCHVSGVSQDYWTNTVSHEVLEMRTDPYVNQTYTQPGGGTGYVEVCDACEQNNQGYRISNVLMSDFVFPSWFKSSGTSPFDQTRLISAPFQVLPGGYLP